MTPAYVIGILDITQEPPVLKGIDIFSEPSPTISLRYRTFVIAESQDATFAAAKKRLLRVLFHSPLYRWCLTYLDPRTQAELNEV